MKNFKFLCCVIYIIPVYYSLHVMQHIDTARPMFETAEQSNLSYAVK